MFEQIRQQLEEQPAIDGITIIDASQFPAPLGTVLRRFMRAGPSTVATFATHFALTSAEAQILADRMVAKGLLTCNTSNDGGEPHYHVRLISARGRKVSGDLLRALEDD